MGIQMKSTPDPVNPAISDPESTFFHLAQVTVRQKAELAQTLHAVEQMTQSIQAVAFNAQQAIAIEPSTELEKLAIDKTVQRLLKLRETVAHTARKVQRLDGSLQQISQAVGLIYQIALQSPLLKTNTTLEVAPPNAESQDYSAVMGEIGMVPKTDLIGDRQLQDAKRSSLEQILELSHTVDQLMQLIAKAAISHFQTSQTVAQLMQAIALASEPGSETAHMVSVFLTQPSSHLQMLLTPVDTPSKPSNSNFEF